MKYSPRLYSKALFALLDAHPKKQDAIIKGFAKMCVQLGNKGETEKITEYLEDELSIRNERKRVVVYSARKLSRESVSKIEKAFGKKSDIKYVIVPDIIAGVRIVIDDETIIDATIKRKIDALVKTENK